MTGEEATLELYRETNKLNPSAIVELYELDARPAGDDSILYFHNGTSGIHNDPILFNGIAYLPMSIQVRGFELSNSGEPPRPTLTIMNVGGWMSSLVLSTKDLVGAKLTRRRTFARFLDGQPGAANVQYPPDIFTVEQKLRENRLLVEFELGSGFDLDGIAYPVRQVISGYCIHDYRGPGCQFSEPMVVTNSGNILQPGIDKYSGRWNARKIFALGDTVGYETPAGEFGVYRSLVNDNKGNLPTDASKWERIQRFRGKYSSTVTDYVKNDVVFVERFGVKVFSIVTWSNPGNPNVPTTAAPPNAQYWATDSCAKFLIACKYRHDPLKVGKPIPYGAFPGVLNLPEV